jgi:starch synthase
MRVVMIAGEATPYAKVGGLADVIGALPPQLEKLGVAVSILIPRYRTIDLQRHGFHPYPVSGDLNFDVQTTVLPQSSVRVFLIGINYYFDREGIYLDSATGLDYPDQADRWIAFQRAALEFVRVALSPVDILHCHDHQAALIPGYVRKLYSGHPGFSRTRTVLTIHNMGYQGIFPPSAMAKSGFDVAEFFPGSPFEYFGQLNFMKVGVVFADLVTTVSPKYAKEIEESSESSFGLNGVLNDRRDRVIGILNGIDYDVWNPLADLLIPARFSGRSEETLEGKTIDKRALLHAFGLGDSRMDKPLLSMLTRIDVQKGIDLLIDVLDELLDHDLSFVLLGTGNRESENALKQIASRHPGRMGIRLAYDESLSHLVFAGADMFLMPSKYEPCGLTQLYSMCYGTVPVVRATGGLADTVQDFDPVTGQGTGFSFSAYESGAFKEAVVRAVEVWNNKTLWRTLMKNGMASDFSWTRSAQQYLDVYQKLTGSL